MKYNWVIVHESDDETGNPTCWSAQIDSEQYGKYVWITHNSKGLYDVEVKPFDDFNVLVSCKSLASAKRWVTMNIH